jgi:hypothetical protein
MPQDMKPSRFASDLINCVYVDLWFMIIRIVVNKRKSIAPIAVKSFPLVS